ncbi:hypothetical protein PMLGA01_080039000, partial [Plasmodium malariae]
LKDLNYIKRDLFLNYLKIYFVKKKVNVYEYIIMLSYLFYKRSKYLDFNKVYLYNTMKKLSPCLWTLNRKCNDIEIRNLFYFMSKIFILHDYFIFRINIFIFNWFILYIYKIKLKNVSYIEDINLLINFMTGFLTNKKFLNYSILFIINVILQKNTGRSLYIGLNYDYICSLYISLFSKIICFSKRHKKIVSTCKKYLRQFGYKIKDNDFTKTDQDGRADASNAFLYHHALQNSSGDLPLNHAFNENNETVRCRRRSRNSEYTLSKRVIRNEGGLTKKENFLTSTGNNTCTQNGEQNTDSEIINMNSISTRQDLI